MRRAIGRWAVLGMVARVLAIQLVPYGRDHTNPPVLAEPQWDSPRTRELAVRACYDCHSNQTTWPWYANVAPVSWRVQQHVAEGRGKVNYTAWSRPQPEAADSAEAVAEGAMPPRDYLLVHLRARLTDAERQELIRGLAATFGGGREGTRTGALFADTPMGNRFPNALLGPQLRPGTPLERHPVPAR
jgi:hypothetical protein